MKTAFSAQSIHRRSRYGLHHRLTFTDFGDLHTFNVAFDQVECRSRTKMNGVEAMWTHELTNRHYQAKHQNNHLELGVGARFLQLEDYFGVVATVAFWADILEYLARQSTSSVPKLRAKWINQRQRWRLSADTRFMFGYNTQNWSQENGIGAELVPVHSIGCCTLSPRTSVMALRLDDFSPIGELRLESAYYLTQTFALKVGYTGMYVGNIRRAATSVQVLSARHGLPRFRHAESDLQRRRRRCRIRLLTGREITSAAKRRQAPCRRDQIAPARSSRFDKVPAALSISSGRRSLSSRSASADAQQSPRYGCSTATLTRLGWRIRNSSSSIVKRCRSGLSGRNSSSNCSARSKVANSISLLVNIRLQLRETSFSVNNVGLLVRLTRQRRHDIQLATSLHSIDFGRRLQSRFVVFPSDGGVSARPSRPRKRSDNVSRQHAGNRLRSPFASAANRSIAVRTHRLQRNSRRRHALQQLARRL